MLPGEFKAFHGYPQVDAIQCRVVGGGVGN